MIVRDSEKTPPAPTPAIALPMMNIVVFFAVAQTRDPIMTNDMTTVKTLFTAKLWYTLPQVGCSVVVVSKYAEVYQLASDNEWKSFVMRGLGTMLEMCNRCFTLQLPLWSCPSRRGILQSLKTKRRATLEVCWDTRCRILLLMQLTHILSNSRLTFRGD